MQRHSRTPGATAGSWDLARRDLKCVLQVLCLKKKMREKSKTGVFHGFSLLVVYLVCSLVGCFIVGFSFLVSTSQFPNCQRYKKKRVTQDLEAGDGRDPGVWVSCVVITSSPPFV